MRPRWDKVSIILFGFLLAGCGFGNPGGFVLTQTGHHAVAVLPQHPPRNAITLSKGSDVRVAFGATDLTIPPANITRLVGSVAHKTWWVPVLTVPTVTGLKLTLQGDAIVTAPVVWKSADGHWNGSTRTARIAFPRQVPSKTPRGGQITLAVKVRGTIIHGTSPATGRQTIVVTTVDSRDVRWQGLKRTSPIPHQDIGRAIIGQQAPWMPGTGGSLGWFTQQMHWTAAGIVPFHARARYRESIVPGWKNNHDNIIMYDRNSHGHYWYITKFPWPSWLKPPTRTN